MTNGGMRLARGRPSFNERAWRGQGPGDCAGTRRRRQAEIVRAGGRANPRGARVSCSRAKGSWVLAVTGLSCSVLSGEASAEAGIKLVPIQFGHTRTRRSATAVNTTRDMA
jgi:hypothetical protein